jgi:hypothetical protein
MVVMGIGSWGAEFVHQQCFGSHAVSKPAAPIPVEATGTVATKDSDFLVACSIVHGDAGWRGAAHASLISGGKIRCRYL